MHGRGEKGPELRSQCLSNGLLFLQHHKLDPALRLFELGNLLHRVPRQVSVPPCPTKHGMKKRPVAVAGRLGPLHQQPIKKFLDVRMGQSIKKHVTESFNHHAYARCFCAPSPVMQFRPSQVVLCVVAKDHTAGLRCSRLSAFRLALRDRAPAGFVLDSSSTVMVDTHSVRLERPHPLLMNVASTACKAGGPDPRPVPEDPARSGVLLTSIPTTRISSRSFDHFASPFF